jgi:hypothetical protein
LSFDMRKIIWLFISVFFLSSCGVLKSKKMTKITANHTIHYCGGEAPTPEMEEIFNKPQLVKNTKCYLHKNMNREDAEIVIEFNEKGVAVIPRLTPGDYFLYKESKEGMKRPEDNLTPDELCLFNEKMMFLVRFTVTKKSKRIHLEYLVPCSPCQEPMP